MEQALDHGRSAAWCASWIEIAMHSITHLSTMHCTPVCHRSEGHGCIGLLDSLSRICQRIGVLGRASESGPSEKARTLSELFYGAAGGVQMRQPLFFAHQSKQSRAALETAPGTGNFCGPGRDRAGCAHSAPAESWRSLATMIRRWMHWHAPSRLSSEAGDLEHLALAVAGIARAHRDEGTRPAGRLEPDHPAPQSAEGGRVESGDRRYTLHRACTSLLHSREIHGHHVGGRARGIVRSCSRKRLAACRGQWQAGDPRLSRRNRLEEARDVLEAAVPLADASGNLHALVRALTSLAATAGRSGKLQEALTDREHSLAAAERQLGDQNSISRRAWSHVGGAEPWLGQWEAARTHYTRARAVADSIRTMLACALSLLRALLSERCDWRLRRRRTPRGAWPGNCRTERSLPRRSSFWNGCCRTRTSNGRDRVRSATVFSRGTTRLGAGHPSIPWILTSLAEAHGELGESGRRATWRMDGGLARCYGNETTPVTC